MKKIVQDQGSKIVRHHDHLLQKSLKSPRKAKAVRNAHQPIMVAG